LSRRNVSQSSNFVYFLISFLSIRPFSVDGVVEEPWDMPDVEPVSPVVGAPEAPVVGELEAPVFGALELSIPDFDISFVEGVALGFGTLFVPVGFA
jgi:hypothetical protein